MKRLFLFTVLLCACYIGITAQTKDYFKDKKHELRLSFGSVTDDMYYDRFYYSKNYWYEGGGNYLSYGGSNMGRYTGGASYKDGAYYNGKMKTTGVLGGSYFYNMSKIRFSFGGTFSYSGYNTDIFERISGAKEGYIKGHTIAFTPTIRYSWLSKSCFRLYSGIGFSMFYDIRKSKLGAGRFEQYGRKDESKFDTSFQLTPIGFSVGKDIFAFGEVNIGGRTGTFVGGVGYRF